MQTVLVAVDDFTKAHIEQIRRAVNGWANVEDILQATPDAMYRERLRKADAVVGWPSPAWLLDTKVQLLQIGSSGWDTYEGQNLESTGIAVCSGRGIHAVAVAEHCMSMMLALARRLPQHVTDKQNKVFCRRPPYGEIFGSTACIVGAGSIGLKLAALCAAFGMRVTGVVRDTSKAYPQLETVFPLSELKTAIGSADHIFMTASGNAGNRNLFSREVLHCLRPTSYFYNVSRGTTVDESALHDLLSAGRIAGAGLDVSTVEPLAADSPLWNLGPNVLITGHSGGLSAGYPDRFCQLAIENLTRFHRGEPLLNRVV